VGAFFQKANVEALAGELTTFQASSLQSLQGTSDAATSCHVKLEASANALQEQSSEFGLTFAEENTAQVC
jgi:hypothetical protein